MRVLVVGGFLGAGKTTAIRALAAHLGRAGERVAVVTNDQGGTLVDTSLLRGASLDVTEIVGGCFCCRYDELEAALVAARREGATIALAEAVGSCTDLVATVLAPLSDRLGGDLAVGPLSVVVDPGRLREQEARGLGDEVAYLFRKQIEEADVVVLSRADLSPEDVTDVVRAINPNAAVVPVSGREGTGLDAWLAASPSRPAAPLAIDYDTYAEAEAQLGWCNARVAVSGAGLSERGVATAFLSGLGTTPLAHVKLTRPDGAGGHAAVVRRGEPPSVTFPEDRPAPWEWLVNARVAIAPEELEARLREALAVALPPGASATWTDLRAFRPGRPEPRHRYTFRCGTSDEGACCAAFYDRPDVRALLGDSWHPGGTELTLRVAAALALRPGGHVLDVACGKGESLRAIRAKLDVMGTGVDREARVAGEPWLTVLRGDAHALPVEDRAFDAVLCECALSTFDDPTKALSEMRRALRPGGRVGLTDMAVEGEIPEALRAWVHTGTCLGKALDEAGYVTALEGAGFRVVERWDVSSALVELLRRIKRNLVGAAFAAASRGGLGPSPADMRTARDTLREAEAAVSRGAIRYVALVAENPS